MPSALGGHTNLGEAVFCISKLLIGSDSQKVIS